VRERRALVDEPAGPALSRHLLRLLGLPTFGLSFAITVLTTYGPILLLHLAGSTTKVGVLIGGEGAFALVVPLLAGALSDKVGTGSGTWGRRLPFVAAGAPLVVVALVLFPFSDSTPLAASAILGFYIGYYLYYPPYRALYADLLPRSLYARSQAGQAVARGLGLGMALLAGGLLLNLWTPLPFILGGGVVVLSSAALLPVANLQRSRLSHAPERPPTPVSELLLHHRAVRAFVVANALWEFSYAGLKSFIVLYVTHGLDHSPATASGVIAVVAVAYVAGAPLASWLSGRYGLVPVMGTAAVVYGIGLSTNVVVTTITPTLIVLPFLAVAGSVLLTLPQALAFTVSPEGSEGAAAGLVDFSRGVGLVFGPIAVGAAVSLSKHTLTATHGFAALWPVIGIPILLSLIPLRLLSGAAVLA
jgi:MFS family permease